jgi:hypothetical protein
MSTVVIPADLAEQFRQLHARKQIIEAALKPALEQANEYDLAVVRFLQAHGLTLTPGSRIDLGLGAVEIPDAPMPATEAAESQDGPRP